jgi:hypothetical protein
MSQLDTIFSAPDKKTDADLEAATERQKNQQREVSEIVATLAAQKSPWVSDYSCDEILRGWASLR